MIVRKGIGVSPQVASSSAAAQMRHLGGCTIADLIRASVAGAKNHGQFMSKVAKITSALQRKQIISAADKDAIHHCMNRLDRPRAGDARGGE